jgi:hypothetical protein
MTKSRRLRFSLVALALAWPAAAFADPPIATAEQAIAGYEAEVDEVMEGVCGRGEDSRMRVPYMPVPGDVHRVAGHVPTGRDALAADRCIRLCQQGVMIDVAEAVSAIRRGLDRLLHPD